jgi:hypothetical protein
MKFELMSLTGSATGTKYLFSSFNALQEHQLRDVFSFAFDAEAYSVITAFITEAIGRSNEIGYLY